jgi:molybdopterin molybdotransferase
MTAIRQPLKSLDAALSELLANAHVLPDLEDISTFDADGRVLAEVVVSELQVPPHDNSAMDGYALRCADVTITGTVLRVTQRIPAGASGHMVAQGQCARIFTGAPMPPGADAVVAQEVCEIVDQTTGQVRINTAPEPGQNIRRAGEDVCKGSVVLEQGVRLTPSSLGLAASIGRATLQVVRQPKVALFCTGNELVMPGSVLPQDMPEGTIYNSNRFFLRTLLTRLGCVVSDCGILPDVFEATTEAFTQAAASHDLVLTSGGVSVGEEDHVKPAIQAIGSLDLWQLAIKPGKPFGFGSIRRPDNTVCHFCGLPGNPVSSFITFALLVRPFVLRLQGCQSLASPRTRMPAHFIWPKADRREEFLRVKRNASGGLDLFGNQSSGVLTSVVWGDGVVCNPAGETIGYGDLVDFVSFSDLLA